jgi:signal transduction histidine kinase
MGWWLLFGGVLATLTMLFVSRWRQRRRHRLEIDALRQRISQDLHDEIGSSLGSIVFISQDIMTAAKDDPLVKNELAEIQTIARQTVDSMHDITRVMQSEKYGQDDLITHLREIATRMLRTLPYTLRLDSANLPRHFPRDRHRDLVLMFKEALHNILQHAHATRVEITLAHTGGQLTLTVRDNGQGFDPATPLSGGGMGLANLRRRAAKLDGGLQLTSAPGHGTALAITIPTP